MWCIVLQIDKNKLQVISDNGDKLNKNSCLKCGNSFVFMKFLGKTLKISKNSLICL